MPALASPLACPPGGCNLACGQEGRQHDATLLLHRHPRALAQLPLMVDQGSTDAFLPPSEANGPAGQLQPEALREALRAAGRLDAEEIVRMQPGYDHSYFFIATFVEEHLEFHARALGLAV